MTTYVWFVRGREHAAMCRTSIESVRRADKGCSCLVITDDIPYEGMGDVLGAIPDALVVHIKHAGPMMVANIEAQIHALTAGHSDITFLDTDVLLLQPIPSIGELTVTWRDHVAVSDEGEKIAGIAAAMPYNYGVMRVKTCKATVEAFIWLRERVRRMHRQQQNWYGNQLAMTELAGPRPAVGTQIDVRRIPWQLAAPSTFISIGKIPCEQYNWTPSKPVEVTVKGDTAIFEGPPVHALHFKGKSRHLMEGYAKALCLGWYV